MYGVLMANQPKASILVANLMTHSKTLEEYLQQGGPLTDLQVEAVSLTVNHLQLFLDTWKRKHDKN
jgi:hypothetical protein